MPKEESNEHKKLRLLAKKILAFGGFNVDEEVPLTVGNKKYVVDLAAYLPRQHRRWDQTTPAVIVEVGKCDAYKIRKLREEYLCVLHLPYEESGLLLSKNEKILTEQISDGLKQHISYLETYKTEFENTKKEILQKTSLLQRIPQKDQQSDKKNSELASASPLSKMDSRVSATPISDSSSGAFKLTTCDPEVLRQLGPIVGFVAQVIERKFLELAPSCPHRANGGGCRLTNQRCAVVECPKLRKGQEGVEKDEGEKIQEVVSQ